MQALSTTQWDARASIQRTDQTDFVHKKALRKEGLFFIVDCVLA